LDDLIIAIEKETACGLPGGLLLSLAAGPLFLASRGQPFAADCEGNVSLAPLLRPLEETLKGAPHDLVAKVTTMPSTNPAVSSTTKKDPQITLQRSELLRAYRTMKMIREFEERIHVEFATGEIPGFVHLYAGEEAIATGFCLNLDARDKITSTHRGHGHCIARGCDVHGMMAEIYGKKTGLCAGKGGSMHIADLAKGMLGANGIVGGGPPLACGAALSAKKLRTGGVAVSFVGDGGANQGTMLESLNLASIWQLPCIFVIENNGYAEATSCKYSGSCHDFADRAHGFNMPGVIVDGHDFLAIYEVAKEAVRRARDGKGPTLVECKVSRYYGHFEGDAQSYRGPDEVKGIRATRDCLTSFVEKITSAGLLTRAELESIDGEILAAIEDSVAKAKAAAKPSSVDLLTDVYTSY